MEHRRRKSWKLVRNDLLEDSKEGNAARQKLFQSMDNNKSGSLTLNEIQVGIIHELKVEELVRCKIAIFKAFEAVLSFRKKGKFTKSDQFITFSEFKKFLFLVLEFYDFFEMFQKVDSNSNKMIDFYEFAASIPIIEKWGVIVHDAEKAFGEIDHNKSGAISFDEFCNWAIKYKIALAENDSEYIDE